MKRVMMAAVAAAAVAMSGSVMAQTTIQEPDRVQYQKVTRIDIQAGDEIEGTLRGPTGEYSSVKPRIGGFRNLVEVRKSFGFELHRSTDNL